MRLGRKITGGKYKKRKKKKLYELTGQPRTTILGKIKRKQLRTRGGNKKTILLNANEANVLAHGKTQKVKIENVLETPQNIFLARQNRLTKGAIIKTSLGKARITNRPSQEGQINAILVD